MAPLVWDVIVEKRRHWQMLADKIPFGIIVLFFGWMTMQAQPPTRMPHNLFVMASAELSNLWLLTGFGKYVLYRNAPNPATWSAFPQRIRFRSRPTEPALLSQLELQRDAG